MITRKHHIDDSQLFTVLVTERVDIKKNPPFLISFKIDVNEELKTFLDSNLNTSLDNVGIRVATTSRSAFLYGPYVDVDRHEGSLHRDKYVKLTKVLDEEVTFSFQDEKVRKKVEKLAIKQFKYKYTDAIKLFLNAKAYLEKNPNLS